MKPSMSSLFRLGVSAALMASRGCFRKAIVPASPVFRLKTASKPSPPPSQILPASSFSTSSRRPARPTGPGKDRRITLIRYFLNHPLTPRPLRFSRVRALRHWTIHRAWQLQRAKDKQAHELELERMYNAQRAACEELRLLPGDNGRLYRRSMTKKGVYGEKGGWPIEASRAQTDYPPSEPWNGDWMR